jgi:hypothetical protein
VRKPTQKSDPKLLTLGFATVFEPSGLLGKAEERAANCGDKAVRRLAPRAARVR